MKVRAISLLKAALSILAVQVFSYVTVSTGNMLLFYSLSFLFSAAQPVLFIAVIPRLVSLFVTVHAKDRSD